VPADKRIVVSEADAVRFACNAINFDRQIIINQSAPIALALGSRGFHGRRNPPWMNS